MWAAIKGEGDLIVFQLREIESKKALEVRALKIGYSVWIGYFQSTMP
jgi:hypothetical protein